MQVDAEVEVIQEFLTDSVPGEALEVGQRGVVRAVDGRWIQIDFEDVEKLQWVELVNQPCLQVRMPPVQAAGAWIQDTEQIPASSLEGNADGISQYLMRCERIMNPMLWSAPIPQWMIETETEIKDLWRDYPEHHWTGLSGDEVFYVMIEHARAESRRCAINSMEEMINVIEGLEWATHDKARVKAHDLPIPHGFYVNLKSLQQCLGQGCEVQKEVGPEYTKVVVRGEIVFRPVRLHVHLPRFDVLPSAFTVFREGDKIYGGCRNISFRTITIETDGACEAIRNSLDDQNKLLRYPVQVECLRQDPNLPPANIGEVVKLHAGFEFLGHRNLGEQYRGEIQPHRGDEDQHELMPGLVRGRTLVFRVKPSQMVLENFPNVTFGNIRMDFDFFRVENLEREMELWEAPVNRKFMRTNILGIARLRAVNQHYVYNVDWFPKRASKIQNGDVMFLPRLPAEQLPGESQRFWTDRDIADYAHPFEPMVPGLCNIGACAPARNNDCVIDPCGHGCCHECLMKHIKAQVGPNSCPWCRGPVRGVIRYPQPDP